MYAIVEMSTQNAESGTIHSVYSTLEECWKYDPSRMAPAGDGGFRWTHYAMAVIGDRRPTPGETLPIRRGPKGGIVGVVV